MFLGSDYHPPRQAEAWEHPRKRPTRRRGGAQGSARGPRADNSTSRPPASVHGPQEGPRVATGFSCIVVAALMAARAGPMGRRRRIFPRVIY